MTPNQIGGVAAALAILLEEGHAGICEPDAHTAEVRKVFDGCGTVLVSTFWIEPEGTSVVLSAFVSEDGSVTRDDARWPETVQTFDDGWATFDVFGPSALDNVVREAARLAVKHWAPDPEGRPGVRLNENGVPHYSSAWLP